MKKSFLSIFTCVFYGSICVADADKDDAKFEYSMNRVNVDSVKKFKYLNLKILKVKEDGECGPDPESCPKYRVYLSVSTREEYPDYKLFLLPEPFDWRLEHSEEREGGGDDDYSLELTLVNLRPSQNLRKEKWTEVSYRVVIDMKNMKLEKLK